MKTQLTKSLRVFGLLALICTLTVTGVAGNLQAAKAAPMAASKAAAPAARLAADLPAETCTLVAPGERLCELYARFGTLTLPDGVMVPVWGFSFNPTGAVEVPGPALIVNQGENVTISLTNQIAGEEVSLSVPGQAFLPDQTGAATGDTQSYSFLAQYPGTYSYEAGLTANGPIQVAMGLFGPLIVRPAGNPSAAYDDFAGGTIITPTFTTDFTDEALLVLSEVDPVFNTSPDLATFNPKYWLLNGFSYNQTSTISVAPGSTLLLRYLNAGLQEHSIGVLGLHQTVVGLDNHKLPYSYRVVAETIGAGQALDVIVSIPPNVTVGTRYPVYNTGLQQNHNSGELTTNNQVAFGGILTFIEVTGGTPAADTGPLATSVSITPGLANSSTDVTLDATLDETNTGGEDVVAAEYFTNTIGLPGSGIALPVAPGISVNVSALIPAATLAGWEQGDVTFYVRGQDASGDWGPISSTVLDLVTGGPAIRGMVVSPSPTNGSRPVMVRATADGTLSGGLNVMAAEYFVDATGANGTGSSMALNMLAPIVEASATIPQPFVDGLTEGEHVIYIHGMDEFNNWGAFSAISLWIDKTGPPSTGSSLAPNPNNGRTALNASSNSIRLMAEAGIIAEISPVERAEGFINTIGADGAGFPLVAYDALYNNKVEVVYVDLPLPTINLLAEGPNPIYFHAKDKAGNWGTYDFLTLVIDKTGPINLGATLTPNPTAGAASVQLLASFQDPDGVNANGTAPGSTIVAAEWFMGVDPGAGFANPMIAFDGSFDTDSEIVQALINVTGWANGNYIINTRARDLAGNWSAITQTTLSVTAAAFNSILQDNFESGDLGSWSGVVGEMAVDAAARLDAGSLGLQAKISGSASAYLADQSPAGEKDYRASFLFNPHWSYSGGSEQEIFVGRDAAGTSIFGIQYRDGYSGQSAAVRAWALVNGEKAFTEWAEVKSNVRQNLSLSWHSDKNGSLLFVVDGKTVQMLNNLDTSAFQLEEVWLGPSGGLTENAFGSQYFDEFVSQRSGAPQLDFKLFIPSVRR